MRITRLYLRNYRTFADELDLELPSGVIGVYGVNGVGKSALIESIRWTLYGKTRTPIPEVRTTGVQSDCITEVEFEHDSHLYLVRRTITGVNHTVKAEAHCNGHLAASSVSEVARYVHSVIGMDDQSFRASVFAEQKQISSFSNHQPRQRKELVMRLLGITPLDKAKDAAGKDARAIRDQHDRVRALLADVDELTAAVDDAKAAADEGERQVAVLAELTATATAAALAADQALADQQTLASMARDIDTEGKHVRKQRDDAAAQVDHLTGELTTLEAAASQLALLQQQVAELPTAETRLALVQAVAQADQDLADLPPLVEPEPLDEKGADEARARADALGADLAEVTGLIQAAAAELKRAEAAAAKSGELSGEGECPVCGQELGAAFETVQRHRADEVTQARARLAAHQARQAELAASVDEARRRAAAARAAFDAARKADDEHRLLSERRRLAEQRAAAARAQLDRPLQPGEPEQLAATVKALKAAAAEAEQLKGRLERRPQVEAMLAEAQRKLQEAEDQRQNLLEKRKALGFDPAALDAATAAAGAARAARDQATQAENAARNEAVRYATKAEEAQIRLAEAQRQHETVKDLAEESRHLDRLSTLMSQFRDSVVATIGPKLANDAASLFAELTDNEYDLLDVNPETYELRISDKGQAFGMDRYSGSEVDLANLALRVAISEQVRFQAGGAVGLLVLDEVFGPLDSDRKDRMLMALERLKGRFRQVLVVTHDNEIKEQLPNAIEVIKLGPRRATARLLNA